jgi:N-acetylglutamate synthase-like GNAT family acetyltransferase
MLISGHSDNRSWAQLGLRTCRVTRTNQELNRSTDSLTPISAIVYALGMSELEDLLIRRAATSEQRELEELQLRASLTNTGDRDALLAHPDAIELPVAQIAAGGVFVAERRGTIVGFAAVEQRADGESELDALFVDPSMRRRGIARSLVVHCAEVARTRESASLYVVGNSHAKEFYTACGFSVIGTSETRFGTGLLMRMMI